MSGTGREILKDRYVLLKEHQSGGMATIYQARILDTGELVAVKRTFRTSRIEYLRISAASAGRLRVRGAGGLPAGASIA
jgi:hypothetical protein